MSRIKVTDYQLMTCIFAETLAQLPNRNIQRYVGGRISMTSDRYALQSTRLLSVVRTRLNCDLSDSHLLKRLRQLVDLRLIASDEQPHMAESARTFYYWLPESITSPVLARCRQVLAECGVPDEKNPATLGGAVALASSVAEQLLQEFTLVKLRGVYCAIRTAENAAA
ncbi:hypothetical protein [Pantoea sp. CCBC3-3-1]|uniref:hypothetical protein n=1 Tax=Pantoea sp. CCBC3-3-1 TaxID=2490851 RepID=UPI0011BD9C8A|nr:hypothetical protein [Pantoea sp. CCBC3-3-1]